MKNVVHFESENDSGHIVYCLRQILMDFNCNKGAAKLFNHKKFSLKRKCKKKCGNKLILVKRVSWFKSSLLQRITIKNTNEY